MIEVILTLVGLASTVYLAVALALYPYAFRAVRRRAAGRGCAARAVAAGAAVIAVLWPFTLPAILQSPGDGRP